MSDISADDPVQEADARRCCETRIFDAAVLQFDRDDNSRIRSIPLYCSARLRTNCKGRAGLIPNVLNSLAFVWLAALAIETDEFESHGAGLA